MWMMKSGIYADKYVEFMLMNIKHCGIYAQLRSTLSSFRLFK